MSFGIVVDGEGNNRRPHATRTRQRHAVINSTASVGCDRGNTIHRLRVPFVAALQATTRRGSGGGVGLLRTKRERVTMEQRNRKMQRCKKVRHVPGAVLRVHVQCGRHNFAPPPLPTHVLHSSCIETSGAATGSVGTRLAGPVSFLSRIDLYIVHARVHGMIDARSTPSPSIEQYGPHVKGKTTGVLATVLVPCAVEDDKYRPGIFFIRGFPHCIATVYAT